MEKSNEGGIFVIKKASFSELALSLFLVLVYVGLPVFILIGFIPFDYKFYVLTVGAVIVYVVARTTGLSNEALGITTNNAKPSVMAVLPFTLILVIIGIVIWISGYSRMTPNETWPFFIFYIFVSSPVQEFLYRGALPAFLRKRHFNNSSVCFISTFLYSFVHIIYKDWLTLLFTFAIGLIWFFCYNKSKNLIGVSFSHAILGVITIIAGIID